MLSINESFSRSSHGAARKSLEITDISDLPAGLDEGQVILLTEPCILVDQQDRNIGTASKKTCHLLNNINNGMNF